MLAHFIFGVSFHRCHHWNILSDDTSSSLALIERDCYLLRFLRVSHQDRHLITQRQIHTTYKGFLPESLLKTFFRGNALPPREWEWTRRYNAQTFFLFFRERRWCRWTVITFVEPMEGVSDKRLSIDCISSSELFRTSRCFQRTAARTLTSEKSAWRGTCLQTRIFVQFCSMCLGGIQASGSRTRTAPSCKICAQTLQKHVGKDYVSWSVVQTLLRFEIKENNDNESSDYVKDYYLTYNSNEADAIRACKQFRRWCKLKKWCGGSTWQQKKVLFTS